MGDGDGGENECVLTIPLEPNLPYLAISSSAKIEAVVEAERAQKKKAKKTKLLIAQHGLSYPLFFPLLLFFDFLFLSILNMLRYVDPGVQPPRESPHKSRLVRSVTDLKSLLAKKSFSTMSSEFLSCFFFSLLPCTSL